MTMTVYLLCWPFEPTLLLRACARTCTRACVQALPACVRAFVRVYMHAQGMCACIACTGHVCMHCMHRAYVSQGVRAVGQAGRYSVCARGHACALACMHRACVPNLLRAQGVRMRMHVCMRACICACMQRACKHRVRVHACVCTTLVVGGSRL